MVRTAGEGAVTLRIGREAIGTCDQVLVISGPTAAQSKRLLAHELTHVVQQKAGQKVSLQLSKVSFSGAKPKLAGQVLQIDMKDDTGRVFAMAGKVQAGGNDVMAQEWTITYESIQRVL